MTCCNIPKNTIDPFYRYRREVIRVRSGRANTTVVENVGTISKQINRDLTILNDVFKKSLGCSGSIRNGEIHLKGDYSVHLLEATLEKFILDDIVCSHCGCIETSYVRSKKICSACGY